MTAHPTVNPRALRSRARLQEALLDLVGERALDQIGVSDVTKRANVNRSTFYEHFTDTHDLAAQACTALFDEIIAAAPVLGPGSPRELQRHSGDLLADLFARIGERADLYRALLGPTGSARVIDHLHRRLTIAIHVNFTDPAATDHGDDPAEIPDDPAAALLAGTLLSAATDWLRRGCPESPAQMSARLGPVLRALLIGDPAADRLLGPLTPPATPQAPTAQEAEGAEEVEGVGRGLEVPVSLIPQLQDVVLPSGAGSQAVQTPPERGVHRRLRKGRASRGELHDRLLEAAQHLFVSRGYRGTSLQDLATEVGCSKASVLYHFADKQAILRELLTPALDAIRDLAARLAVIPDDRVPEAAVTGFVDITLRFRSEVGLLLADVSEATGCSMDLDPLDLGDLLIASLAGRSADPQARMRAWMALGTVLIGCAATSELPIPPAEARQTLIRTALQVLAAP